MSLLPSLQYFFPLGLVLAWTADADTRNWNPTGEGCVDPSNYLSCYQTQTSNAGSCIQFCESTNQKGTQGYQTCVLGCGGAWQAGNIGCWIQSCWNQVYSCEYQLTALNYFSGNGLVQNGNVPFYPPPDSASAGACTCNLGYVYGNLTYTNFNNACLNVATSGDRDALSTCSCCQFSFPLSNILNACPKSDLSIFGIADKIASTQSLVGNSADNCSILDNGPEACITQFNYPFYGTKAYNPLNLGPDEPGSEPLSNRPGNAFTEFGVPAYTLKLFPGFSSVITPAAFNTKAGAASQTVNAASGGISITATPSGSGGATSTGKAGSSTTGNSPGTAASSSPTKASQGSMTSLNLYWFLVTFASVSFSLL